MRFENSKNAVNRKDPRLNAVNSNTIAPIILINRLKLCVINVKWNKPPNIPIPALKSSKEKTRIPEYISIRIASQLNNVLSQSDRID